MCKIIVVGYSGAKEIFNYPHSKLQNVIGRCFGISNGRFPFWNKWLLFKFSIAHNRLSFTLHNYIPQETQRDWLFKQLIMKILLSLTATMRRLMMIKCEVLYHLTSLMNESISRLSSTINGQNIGPIACITLVFSVATVCL